jgi:hypothetical protein
MGKKERHEQDLEGIINEFLEGGSTSELMGYLLSNSNLPGRRANLELADAFGDVIEKHISGESRRLWRLSVAMSKISPDEAPVNSPEELLPFCGAIGVGAIGSISAEFYDRAMTELSMLANDPRWRMREAVCFGLHRLLARRPGDSVRRLEEWASSGSFLEMRAAAAGVADPSVLEDGEIAARALHIHDTILGRVAGVDDRRDEGFRILRKALGYTLSVVVHAIPEEGFRLMQRLIAARDEDILWIVKQNVKKKRLAENHPEAVRSIQQLLG